jgi:hypothetical protein
VPLRLGGLGKAPDCRERLLPGKQLSPFLHVSSAGHRDAATWLQQCIGIAQQGMQWCLAGGNLLGCGGQTRQHGSQILAKLAGLCELIQRGGHGWLRTGGRIRERVFQIARARYRTTDEEVGTFYWPEHLDPAAEPPFRGPADEDSVRAADEISLTELASLARAVIAQGSQGEDIYQAMARRLGLQQLRAASRARFENAVSSVRPEP